METEATLKYSTSWGKGKVIAGLILFAALVNAPFLNQAFHMDDGIYLMMAKNIESNFWFPQDKPSYFEGLYVSDLASTEHPWPITSYLLALLAKYGNGYSEIAMHAGFLIFPIILAVSMFYLASRFTRSPVCATFTFLTLPAVYVLSHTLMTDIPLITLWISSAALFCRGVDAGKKTFICLGAVLAGIASLVSYSGLCLIPLLGLYAVLRKKRRAFGPILIIPAGLLGFVLAINAHHYSRFTPDMLLGYYFAAKRVLSPALLIEKFTFAVLVIGATTIFPAVFLVRCKSKMIPIAFAIAFLFLLLTEASGYELLLKLLFMLLFLAGLLPILEIVARTLQIRPFRMDTDEFFLSIWFLGMLAFFVAAYMNGSARYLIPAIAPLILILFRRIETADKRFQRWLAASTIAFAASTGVLSAISDYQFAAIYREFASSTRRILSSPAAKLWFAGEWGFRVYLERAGGRELGRREPSPKPGDLLITPGLATPYQTLFSERLDLDSIAMVAPSRIRFDIPILPADSVLVYTIGMPFYRDSDGMDFSIRFLPSDMERVLKRDRMTPAEASEWRVHEIPLKEFAGMGGSIVFDAEVGSSGNANADWLAIARARICKREIHQEKLIYDFRKNLEFAHIERQPGIEYHTGSNQPVLPMTVWLRQKPAAILRDRHQYCPSLGLRLLDAQCHAGFWSSGWGLLPFSFTQQGSILETISVYEIIRSVDSFGESTPVWYAAK